MTTSDNRLKAEILSDTEITMQRSFKAPRELVYRAMTDLDLIPKWWGQRESTTIVDKLDARVGGDWRFIQRGQDGTEYAFRGKFLELDSAEQNRADLRIRANARAYLDRLDDLDGCRWRNPGANRIDVRFQRRPGRHVAVRDGRWRQRDVRPARGAVGDDGLGLEGSELHTPSLAGDGVFRWARVVGSS